MKTCQTPGCDRPKVVGRGYRYCVECRGPAPECQQNRVKREITASAEERAWAAGFFDGEGCFSTQPRRAIATVSQVDRELLDRFCKIAGCGRVYGPNPQGGYGKGTGAVFFNWRVSARDDVEYVVALLWPWLGTRKREDANRALATAAPGGNHHARKTHCPHGHPYDDENTLWLKGKKGLRTNRVCRACFRTKAYRGRKAAA